MPREYRALDGGHPEFAELYGIQEHDSPLYPPRTLLNVKESGATVRFAGNWQSPGELCTLKAIRQYRKPFFDMSLTIQCGRHLNENLLPFSPENLADWILSNSIVVLNVAGNSESTHKGIEEFVEEFLIKTILILRGEHDE